MKFDARTDFSLEKKEAFIGWLTIQTVSSLQRAAGNSEGLKAATFLFVNRGREAGLELSEIAEVLGIGIARSGLTKKDEDIVLDWAEALDPLAAAVHSDQGERRPWWKFWA